MMFDRKMLIFASILLVVFLSSPILPQWVLFMLTLAAANGLVVLGLMLFLRVGLISFGQALFFCIGAYTTGMLNLYLHISDVFLLMIASATTAGLLAYLLGFLLSKYRAIFFGLLSLAFSMILYGLLVKMESLGSTDGFNIGHMSIFGWTPEVEQIRVTLLAVALVTVLLATIFINCLLKSPKGILLTAIRDNEIRVEYMGASARKTIHLVYVIAGVLAGLGGSIAGYSAGHIDPMMTFWTSSGEFIFITILGGISSVFAPFLGALIFGVIQTIAFAYSPNTWQMTIGIALLVVILILPNGLWSLISEIRKRYL